MYLKNHQTRKNANVRLFHKSLETDFKVLPEKIIAQACVGIDSDVYEQSECQYSN